MSSEFTPTLTTDGIVSLDDLNIALTGYDRQYGSPARRVIVSPRGKTHLDSIAWHTSYTKEYAQSERGRRELNERHRLRRHYRGSQMMAEFDLPDGMFHGMTVEVDHSPDAPLLRVAG